MRILIATGGTGGHIFPALKVAEELRRGGHQILFAGVLGIAEDQILSANFDLINIKAKGLNTSSIISIFKFSFLMVGAIFHAIAIMHKFKPQRVIGFGGYGSLPVIFASWLLGKYIILHEQNVYPGRVNRIMARFAKQIAISFKDSERYLSSTKNRLVFTGCPVHASQSNQDQALLRRRFDLSPHKKTILLLGGSQGSQRLNEVFFEMIKDLVISHDVQAIHMTGNGEYEKYHKLYSGLNLPVYVCAFISNISDAYGAIDVIISRAGAASVTEIGLLGIPAILVPYPFAGGHQKYNAMVLVNASVALMIEQPYLTAPRLKEALEKILHSTPSREEHQEKIKGILLPFAQVRLAELITA